MVLRRFAVFTLFLLLVLAAPVWANTAGVSDLSRVSGVVNTDGYLDDEVWLQALTA